MSLTQWYTTSPKGKIGIYHDGKNDEAYGFALVKSKWIKFLSHSREVVVKHEVDIVDASSSTFPFWSLSNDTTKEFPYHVRSSYNTAVSPGHQHRSWRRYSFTDKDDYRVFLELLRYGRINDAASKHGFCADLVCLEVEPNDGNTLYERSVNNPLIKIWQRDGAAGGPSILLPLRCPDNVSESLELPFSQFTLSKSILKHCVTLKLSSQQNGRLDSIQISFKESKDYKAFCSNWQSPPPRPRLPLRHGILDYEIPISSRDSQEFVQTKLLDQPTPYDRPSAGSGPMSFSTRSLRDGRSSVVIENEEPRTDSLLTPASPNVGSWDAGERLIEQLRYYWTRQDQASSTTNATWRSVDNSSFYDKALGARDAFRVLTILKGKLDDPLRLRFRIRKLKEFDKKENAADSYVAVSYNWGRHEANVPVVLNDKAGFRISTHLQEGLRRLRLPKSDRQVWIDTICINQMNITEMNHQVSIMGEIYKHARRTVIWYHTLDSTGICPRKYSARGDDSRAPTLCTQGRANGEHLTLSIIRQSIKDLLDKLQRQNSSSAWNWRLWCVQEFYFSELDPTVCIGTHTIEWDLFVKVFSEIAGHKDGLTLFEDLRKRKAVMKKNKDKENDEDEDVDQEMKGPPTLHYVCAITSMMSVGNPRDRIFSLIHMGQADDSRTSFEAVYEKSIGEIYEDAVLFMIKQSNSLDVIIDDRPDRGKFGEYDQQKVMSSYIPDFTKLVKFNFIQGKPKYSSGKHERGLDISLEPCALASDSLYPELQHRRLLRFSGKRFGVIKHCTSLGTWITPDKIDQSPSGELIYTGSEKPGRLVEYIFKALKLHVGTNMWCHNLNCSPQLGRLILEYLLEEKRHYKAEIDRCSATAPKALTALLPNDLQRDESYVKNRLPPKSHELLCELKFISDHWNRRRGYISKKDDHVMDLEEMIRDKATKLKPWRDIYSVQEGKRLITSELWQDMQAALEYENLFCYARHYSKDYYMFGNRYFRPMRRDVLKCATKKDIDRLPTQEADRDDKDMEAHKYSAKAREREFFVTDDQFVGLGPASMRDGDVVVVPYGASRPFILRPCQDPPNSYNFVGEAIVPGIMHEEWIRDVDNSKVESFDLI